MKYFERKCSIFSYSCFYESQDSTVKTQGKRSVWSVFTLIHYHKLGGSVSLSAFTWKGDICSLLESVIGTAYWYLFCRETCRLQGNEMQPDQERDRKQRGSCCVDPHSCPGDVTQHLTGGFSIFMTSDKAP